MLLVSRQVITGGWRVRFARRTDITARPSNFKVVTDNMISMKIYSDEYSISLFAEHMVSTHAIGFGGEKRLIAPRIHFWQPNDTVLVAISERGDRGSGFRHIALFAAISCARNALACNAVFGQFAWIEHRDVEGGSANYIEDHISDPMNTIGTAAGIAINMLSDALLIYRSYILWGSSKRVVVFPLLLFFGAFSMSILLIYESARPGASFFGGPAVDFGIPYIALTLSVNITVTTLICGRLLTARNQMKSLLGPHHARTYTNIIAMMIESAAPFTVLGIIFAITYALHSSISIAFVQVWGDFCAISPQLIILRVAMGRAWSKEISQSLIHMTFKADDDSTETLDTTLPINLTQSRGMVAEAAAATFFVPPEPQLDKTD
ncbi:hypothetical protein VNI00_008983 [Paramarasmius palmivorus]|uniref:Uncharacterized protein n=1 Tax=Paramarasmius palmivorus TaxID=297713 RepID=A0AAW0CSR9_9AGAR